MHLTYLENVGTSTGIDMWHHSYKISFLLPYFLSAAPAQCLQTSLKKWMSQKGQTWIALLHRKHLKNVFVFFIRFLTHLQHGTLQRSFLHAGSNPSLLFDIHNQANLPLGDKEWQWWWVWCGGWSEWWKKLSVISVCCVVLMLTSPLTAFSHLHILSLRKWPWRFVIIFFFWLNMGIGLETDLFG